LLNIIVCIQLMLLKPFTISVFYVVFHWPTHPIKPDHGSRHGQHKLYTPFSLHAPAWCDFSRTLFLQYACSYKDHHPAAVTIASKVLWQQHASHVLMAFRCKSRSNRPWLGIKSNWN
jgi:hypothetical protein